MYIGYRWSKESNGRVTWQAEGYQTAEKLIQIANENGWKHEVHTQEYSIDVTEVFDPKSSEGNRLLDFLTHTVNFRETAEEQLVEETLALIRDRDDCQRRKKARREKRIVGCHLQKVTTQQQE